MTSVPEEPGQKIEEHKEGLEKSLLWLESAISSGRAEPETYAEIARSLRGRVESLLRDAKQLEERASFGAHHGLGPTK